jgi:hypothetical protein
MYIYIHSSIYKSPLEQWTLGSLHTREVCSATTALPDWWLSPGYKNIYLYRCIYIPTRVSVSESSDRLSKASALVASHGSGSQSDDSGSSDKRLVVSSLCSGRETRHGERLLYHLSSFCSLPLVHSLSLSLFLSLSTRDVRTTLPLKVSPDGVEWLNVFAAH